MLCIVKTVHQEMVKLGETESARGMIGTLLVNIQAMLQWLIEDSTKLKHVKNVQQDVAIGSAKEIAYGIGGNGNVNPTNSTNYRYLSF